MIFREAQIEDIRQMQIVRNSVKENMLSNAALVPDKDYEEFITGRGKGWVCKSDNTIIGFSFVDLKENNIWALFVRPEHEGKKVGSALQKLMLDWYFNQDKENVWLGTAPNTRAEKFYEKSGWRKTGIVNKGEIKFEMTSTEWLQVKNKL
jgi:GNAT superfamily N-acetyltransferase